MTFKMENELIAMTAARHKMQVERDELLRVLTKIVVPALAKCGDTESLETLYIAIERVKEMGRQ